MVAKVTPLLPLVSGMSTQLIMAPQLTFFPFLTLGSVAHTEFRVGTQRERKKIRWRKVLEKKADRKRERSDQVSGASSNS